MDFVYHTASARIGVNFKNDDGEAAYIRLDETQGVTELPVADVFANALVANEELDAEKELCVLYLDGAATKEEFDNDFWADAAVSIEGTGIEYKEGVIRLKGDVESGAVTFAANGKTLDVEITGYTAPAPVIPKDEDGFAYRFFAVGATATVEDILKANGIISSSYNVVSLSDENAVTIEDDTRTAQVCFDSVTLTVALSDGSEVEIILSNPASVKANETVITEGVGSFAADTEVPAGTMLVVDSNPKVPEGIVLPGVMRKGGPAESDPVFFEVSLIGPDGEPVKAGADVTLNTAIKLPEAPDEGQIVKVTGVKVYHIGEKGDAEELEGAKYALGEGTISSVSFTTPGFSLFAITYTVEYIEINYNGVINLDFTLEKSSLIPEGMKLDKLYHIHTETNEEGETVQTVETLEVTETEDGLVFEVENFSDIVASYTVDFEYNGIQYRMPGGGAMLLSELFEALHIEADATQIENVTFTDPALLTVEP